MPGQLARSLTAVCALMIAGAQELSLPQPKLVSPAAEAPPIPQPVRFEWEDVRGAVAYNIQIAETESFTRPLLVDEGVSGRWFTVEVLPAVPLWWRVRAVDASGKPGRFSAARKFQPRPLAPAAPVFAVTLTPAYVVGGYPSEGLVTLALPAPPGGASVTLSSSDTGAASVPRQIPIPAGAISATFTVETRPVTENRQVRITAGSAGPARSENLTIAAPPPPAVLLSCTVNPATLTGGNVAQGTVRLSDAAPPPKGVDVRLAAGDETLASIPNKVTVPAGQRMVSFPIATGRPGIARSVTISAALNGVTKSAEVTIEGTGALSALEAPEPERPAERERISGSQSVLFRWGSVPGAASYTLQVDGSGSFSNTLVLIYTLPDVETRIAPFRGRLFWWRVRANDSKGAPGNWSTPRMFELE